jgi:hypothetical protein
LSYLYGGPSTLAEALWDCLSEGIEERVHKLGHPV